MNVLTMQDVDLKDKRVLIRQELNVPVKDGKVVNDKRIRASLPTLKLALEKGAKIMVVSHLGRPKAGEYDPAFSFAPVAEHMQELLNVPVTLAQDWIDGVEPKAGEIVLCENVRFLEGEKKDDSDLAKKMAALCDVYIMDAFGAAHRAHASTHGVAKHAAVACAGLLMAGELEALAKLMDNPARPLVAIVGGAKVSTKLTVLDTLSKKVDILIVGGGIANTFIAAQGHPVGKSLYEPDLIDEAKRLMADDVHCEIPLPTDVVVGAELSGDARPFIKEAGQVGDEDLILDIGPMTAKMYAEIVAKAGTVVWNGPVGVFEHDQFAGGTVVLVNALAKSGAFTVAGGGETVTAVEKYGAADKISYISTGGGSFLEFLEGKTLPAVAVLEERAKG
ncbi:MAG: phosphoglycerate kinase [Desulfovibrio sp.]|nr:MAG: phosphoglycerate kinase [Desulfovibrio sp.]